MLLFDHKVRKKMMNKEISPRDLNLTEFVLVPKASYEELILKANNATRESEKLKKEVQKEEHYYDTAEVMRLLNVSRMTLQNWRDKGILPFRRFGRKIRYKIEDIAILEKKVGVRSNQSISSALSSDKLSFRRGRRC